MLKKVERIIFFLLVFSIIIQTGKHFWPSFSFVQGIRVDYLSPTLYISDILIITLFILAIVLSNSRKKLFQLFLNKKLIAILIVLFISVFISISAFSSLYGAIKILEFVFLGGYVAFRFNKNDIPFFIDILSLAALIMSALAFWEFFSQRSIGGIFYFLGERTFNASTIGIATIHFQNGLLLRPYASFPHPNVLAFFLLCAVVLATYRFFYEKDTLEKTFLLFAAVISSGALLLTFSRIIIILFAFFVMYVLVRTFIKRKDKEKILYFFAPFFAFGLYASIFYSRFFNPRFLLQDLNYRADLVSIAWSLFEKYPFFGVGINNFFLYELPYQKVISPTLLQPVHNIYLLIASELGIVGIFILLWFLVKTLIRLKNVILSSPSSEVRDFYMVIGFLFVTSLIIGFFDHFLLTLQQGKLLFTIIIGMCWSNVRKKH